MVYRYKLNGSKFSVKTAPHAVRVRWAKKAWITRKSRALKACRSRLGQCETSCEGEMPQRGIGQMASDFISSIGPAQEPLKRIDEVGRERMTARNPELLVVNNPGGRSKKMRKRRKSSGSKLAIKIGGRRYGWRALVKKYKSIRKAAAVWRKKPKYAGRKALGRCRKAKTCRKRLTRWSKGTGIFRGRQVRRVKGKIRIRARFKARSRRKARNGKLSIRFRGKKVSYKTLARRLGVRGAAKVWRSAPKLHAGKAIPGCGTRRRKRRSR